MPPFSAYADRINLALDHIATHLDGDLSLAALANIAHFSPFHFHRIFKDTVGQTLNQYVNRARLEQAAKLMRSDLGLRALDAALACGYTSAEGFSRAFKKQYGLSPREWDRQSPLQERKIGQVPHQLPIYTVDALQADGFKVKLVALPAQQLAYIRVDDSYRAWERVVAAHDRLMRWYRQHYGSDPPALYGMSQDDPDVTPIEQCRFDWAVPISGAFRPAEGIQQRQIPPLRLAYVAVQGDVALLDRAWQFLWRYWLPHSRYQPDNLPAMEVYQRLPAELGWASYDMWCAVPVIDL